MMLQTSAGRLIAVLAAVVVLSSGYRLNVPRLLLPYHPSINVSFVLEVKSACFYWESSRPEISTVEPIDPVGGCSERALVTAVSKSATEESTTIFARSPSGDISLSCGVSVDAVDSIYIRTTTKVLFFDDVPTQMIVEAFNKEKDKFSTLAGIPFNWQFDGPTKSFRIVPFAESKYDAPTAIQELEQRNQRGSMVLVEGAAPGHANLTVRFAESAFYDIQPNSIHLAVVANVMLIPSQSIYLPVHAVVPYRAVVVKQSAFEDISFPSDEYTLDLTNQKTCRLNSRTLEVTALQPGTTEITLASSLAYAKSVAKPISARITVVTPDAVAFSISHGNIWYLQAGRTYDIHVRLLDKQSNSIYVTENCRFETSITDGFFDVIEKSANGAHLKVVARRSGKPVISSTFVGFSGRPADVVIKGTQTMTISDPITVEPATLVFPYDPVKPYSYVLRITGGTGNYRSRSSQPDTAVVDESHGIVTTRGLGVSTITVEDIYNSQHSAAVHVYVLDPADVRFGESHVEAEVGKDLILNVKFSGLWDKKLLPFTDCRFLPIEVGVDDHSVFTVNKQHKREIPEISSDGCATVALSATSPGDTRVTLKFERFGDELRVAAFPPLKLNVQNDLLVALKSHVVVSIEGGPRPWVLDSQQFFTHATTDSKDIAASQVDSFVYRVQCSTVSSASVVKIAVGNGKSTTNPRPVVATAAIDFCCAVPKRLSLTTKPKPGTDLLPACPAFVHSVFCRQTTELQLLGYGTCPTAKGATERTFDSINGLPIKYDVDQSSLLNVKALPVVETEPDRLYSKATPKNKHGSVKITAVSSVVKPPLSASLALRLVETAEAKPDSIILWNSPLAHGYTHLTGGSGHFWLDVRSGSKVFDVSQESRPSEDVVRLAFRPVSQGALTLRVYDLCIEGAVLEIPVKVADASKLVIEGPNTVQVGFTGDLVVSVVDADGHAFLPADVAFMNVSLAADTSIGQLRRRNDLAYSFSAETIGTTSVVATVRSAAKKLIRSGPHNIEVFAPLRLLPPIVTLIPDAVFQFQIVGGPSNQQNVQFSVAEAGVASVSSIGLITSTTRLGETQVTAAVTTDAAASATKDSAMVRVVSLSGIRIVTASTQVQTGSVITAHIEGLDDRQTPFSFGGAKYPLEVVWQLASETPNDEVGVFDSTLTNIVSESVNNKFSVRIVTRRRGFLDLSVAVTPHRLGQGHFSTNEGVFRASTRIVVENGFRLATVDEAYPQHILLTPDTSLPLVTNRPTGKVLYRANGNIVSVSGSNVLKSGSHAGVSTLIAQHSALNETLAVMVEVLPVASIEMVVETPFISLVSTPVRVLPQGMWIRIRTQFRDKKGRLFDAVSNDLHYRPHRFDLTEIVALDANRTFDIHLKHAGEVVFSVWDASQPQLAAFLRLPVGDVLLPATRSFVSGDLVCFKSPFSAPLAGAGLGWQASASGNHVTFLNRGIAVIGEPGVTDIFAEHNSHGHNATTFASVNVAAPSVISFSSTPDLVSNVPKTTHVFSVVFGTSANASANVVGCSAEELQPSLVRKIVLPFGCELAIRNHKAANIAAINVFAVRPVFLPERGSYACIVKDQLFNLSPQQLTDFDDALLEVTAKWNADSRIATSRLVPFVPKFIVHDTNILLNNMEGSRAVLRISSVSNFHDKFVVTPCTGDVISVRRMKTPPLTADKTVLGNVFFEVSLNIYSPALWTDLAQNCRLTVTFEHTGQTVQVPVAIKVYGDISQATFRTIGGRGAFDVLSDAFQRFQLIIVVAVIGFCTLFVYRELTRVQDQATSTAEQSLLRNVKDNERAFSLNKFRFRPNLQSTPVNEVFNSSSGAATDQSHLSVADKFRLQRGQQQTLNRSYASDSANTSSFLNQSSFG